MGLRARLSNSTALRAGEGRAAGPGSGTRAVCILGHGFGLGLGSRPGIQPRPGLCVGLWNPRALVGAPGVGEGPRYRSPACSPPPAASPPPAPTAQATGTGAGQWRRGAARRGQWGAAGGGAPASAAGRKALEGGGRGAATT